MDLSRRCRDAAAIRSSLGQAGVMLSRCEWNQPKSIAKFNAYSVHTVSYLDLNRAFVIRQGVLLPQAPAPARSGKSALGTLPTHDQCPGACSAPSTAFQRCLSSTPGATQHFATFIPAARGSRVVFFRHPAFGFLPSFIPLPLVFFPSATEFHPHLPTPHHITADMAGGYERVRRLSPVPIDTPCLLANPRRDRWSTTTRTT